MKRTGFRFIERLRVRWAEIDAQQIVFNGHYFTYVDTAITGYWRALALPYTATMQLLGGELFVRKATLEYLGSGRLDDILDVGIRCGRIGNSSMGFEAGVFRGDELLVSGELVYVYADAHAQSSRPVPQRLRESLQAFEAGEPMVQVRVGSWQELSREAQALRTAVFVQEQKIPAELEWDEGDAQALHAVAFNRLGMPLATGRMLPHAPGVARIGRMAVVQAMRGSGVGRQVLDALMRAAQASGHQEVLLHAQVSAVPFYLKAGFAQRGTVFEEAAIPHVEMVRPLP